MGLGLEPNRPGGVGGPGLGERDVVLLDDEDADDAALVSRRRLRLRLGLGLGLGLGKVAAAIVLLARQVGPAGAAVVEVDAAVGRARRLQVGVGGGGQEGQVRGRERLAALVHLGHAAEADHEVEVERRVALVDALHVRVR